MQVQMQVQCKYFACQIIRNCILTLSTFRKVLEIELTYIYVAYLNFKSREVR